MKATKLSVVLMSLFALSLAACGGSELDDAEGDELVSEVEQSDIGQEQQEIRKGASCGTGTYRFAVCNTGSQRGTTTFGCKARTTGRVIWSTTEKCTLCVQRNSYVVGCFPGW